MITAYAKSLALPVISAATCYKTHKFIAKQSRQEEALYTERGSLVREYLPSNIDRVVDVLSDGDKKEFESTYNKSFLTAKLSSITGAASSIILGLNILKQGPGATRCSIEVLSSLGLLKSGLSCSALKAACIASPIVSLLSAIKVASLIESHRFRGRA